MKKKDIIQPAPSRRFSADSSKGLTAAQVAERQAEGCINKSVQAPMKTVRQIIFDNVFTYFNLIFAVFTVLVILVKSYKSLTFLPVIICNTFIGIFQEIRSKKVLDKLNMLNAPQTTVIRDGVESKVNSESLVLDDIVTFSAGNQICADAIVVDGEIKVNESLLTGESDEIVKAPGDELMSGSIVVSGTCHARLDKVGADSYISKLIVQAKTMNTKEQSEMIKSLNRLVKWVGIIIIPIGLALFIQSYFFNGNSLESSVVNPIAAVIGMIPEGLYLLATIALAVSSIRLASNKVLLHDMKSIETLARVDVLCVDKTGTITENTMIVHDLVNLSDNPNIESLIGTFVGHMAADNITMEALKKHFTNMGNEAVTNIIPFSSVFKYSGACINGESYALGAPEYVLRDRYELCRNQIETFASQGIRTLVFAKVDQMLDGKALSGTAQPLALVTLTNPIRESAPATFKYFYDQDVSIKVISGDNPLTVSRVALEAGIVGAEKYIDATTLVEEYEIRSALENYTVFGRVAPDQKRRFVRILKDLGHTVAMTGDGVNDVLALKDADCSVAMASGSDAASQSAQVVLLDSDFSRMPKVVLEGRRTVNNIERSASLFLVKNIFSFCLSLFSIIFSLSYPLQPTQVTLLSAFTIGLPGLLLALESNNKRISGHFISNVLIKSLPIGLTDVIAVRVIIRISEALGLSSAQSATIATLALCCLGLLVVFIISRPMNKFRIFVLVLNFLLILFCSFFVRGLFILEPMNWQMLLILVLNFIVSIGIAIALSFLEHRVLLFIRKKRKKIA